MLEDLHCGGGAMVDAFPRWVAGLVARPVWTGLGIHFSKEVLSVFMLFETRFVYRTYPEHPDVSRSQT